MLKLTINMIQFCLLEYEKNGKNNDEHSMAFDI